MRTLLLACSLALLSAPLAHADSLYTFESIPDGTSLPLSLTDAGLTATFGGQGTACDTSGAFVGLSGIAVTQGFCNDNETGPLTIALSNDVTGLSFNFATNGGEDAVTVDLFNGSILTGTETFHSLFPDPNDSNGEGFAQLTGNFDRASISSASLLAIDNVAATTPEPSSLFLLGTGLLGALGLRRRLA